MTDELIPYYNRHVEYYSPLVRTSIHTITALVEVTIGRRVLDVGCGDGRLAAWLDPDTYLVGVDYAENRVAVARERFPEHVWLCADVETWLESTQDRFDTAVAVEVLEHVHDPLRVISGAVAVANVLVGTVPKNMPDVAHRHVYRDIDDVYVKLRPDRIAPWGQHYVVAWEGKQ